MSQRYELMMVLNAAAVITDQETDLLFDLAEQACKLTTSRKLAASPPEGHKEALWHDVAARIADLQNIRSHVQLKRDNPFYDYTSAPRHRSASLNRRRPAQTRPANARANGGKTRCLGHLAADRGTGGQRMRPRLQLKPRSADVGAVGGYSSTSRPLSSGGRSGGGGGGGGGGNNSQYDRRGGGDRGGGERRGGGGGIDRRGSYGNSRGRGSSRRSAERELLEGWEAFQDEDGDTYYQHQATGQRSWSFPGKT